MPPRTTPSFLQSGRLQRNTQLCCCCPTSSRSFCVDSTHTSPRQETCSRVKQPTSRLLLSQTVVDLVITTSEPPARHRTALHSRFSLSLLQPRRFESTQVPHPTNFSQSWSSIRTTNHATLGRSSIFGCVCVCLFVIFDPRISKLCKGSSIVVQRTSRRRDSFARNQQSTICARVH